MELLQQKAEPYVTEYGENQIAGSGPLWNSIVRSGTEMSPGVGDLLGAEDLQTAAQNNDWGGIGLGMLAAIPGIPSFSRGVKGEARAARGAVNAAADAAPARYAEPSSGAIEVEVLPPEPDYPIRAFHGSPHSFDQFSLDKIGTGEGAQAYGHGLYFAENEGVARQYRDALTTGGNQDYYEMDGRIIRKAWHSSEPDQIAAKTLYENGNDKAASLAQIQRVIESGDTSKDWQGIADMIAQAGEVRRVDPPPGSMYEVSINAHPDTFLDWDRPMAEQPESVRVALEDVLANVPGVRDNLQPYEIDTGPSNGQNLMGAFSEARPGDYRTAMTDELRQRGINGIRYLDGNSRGAGQGSSNYVVFNDELVKILRKYGISGLSTTVGASALAEELDRRGQAQEF